MAADMVDAEEAARGDVGVQGSVRLAVGLAEGVHLPGVGAHVVAQGERGRHRAVEEGQVVVGRAADPPGVLPADAARLLEEVLPFLRG